MVRGRQLYAFRFLLNDKTLKACYHTPSVYVLLVSGKSARNYLVYGMSVPSAVMGFSYTYLDVQDNDGKCKYSCTQQQD